jgi:hypothetical protein
MSAPLAADQRLISAKNPAGIKITSRTGTNYRVSNPETAAKLGDPSRTTRRNSGSREVAISTVVSVSLRPSADSDVTKAAAIPRVFNRLFRVDDARSREDGGAGLGLSIDRALCVAHGAKIELESRMGHGSCFRVHFPRRQLPIAAIRAPEGLAADTDQLP